MVLCFAYLIVSITLSTNCLVYVATTGRHKIENYTAASTKKTIRKEAMVTEHDADGTR